MAPVVRPRPAEFFVGFPDSGQWKNSPGFFLPIHFLSPVQALRVFLSSSAFSRLALANRRLSLDRKVSAYQIWALMDNPDVMLPSGAV